MSAKDIISLVATIISCAASFATCIACYFTYKTTRPNIQIEVDKKLCYYVKYSQEKVITFALVYLYIRNLSMIAGTIDHIFIMYKGKSYRVEKTSMIYDISPVSFTIVAAPENIQIDAIKKRCRCPIRVEGLSFIDGFFLFPNFIAEPSKPITISLFVQYPNFKYKRCIARRLRLIPKTSDNIDEHPYQKT